MTTSHEDQRTFDRTHACRIETLSTWQEKHDYHSCHADKIQSPTVDTNGIHAYIDYDDDELTRVANAKFGSTGDNEQLLSSVSYLEDLYSDQIETTKKDIERFEKDKANSHLFKVLPTKQEQFLASLFHTSKTKGFGYFFVLLILMDWFVPVTVMRSSGDPAFLELEGLLACLASTAIYLAISIAIKGAVDLNIQFNKTIMLLIVAISLPIYIYYFTRYYGFVELVGSNPTLNTGSYAIPDFLIEYKIRMYTSQMFLCVSGLTLYSHHIDEQALLFTNEVVVYKDDYQAYENKITELHDRKTSLGIIFGHVIGFKKSYLMKQSNFSNEFIHEVNKVRFERQLFASQSQIDFMNSCLGVNKVVNLKAVKTGVKK